MKGKKIFTKIVSYLLAGSLGITSVITGNLMTAVTAYAEDKFETYPKDGRSCYTATIGQNLQVGADISKNATDISCNSEDTNVATVKIENASNGKKKIVATAVGAGSTVLHYQSTLNKNVRYATCAITVTDDYKTGIEFVYNNNMNVEDTLNENQVKYAVCLYYSDGSFTSLAADDSRLTDYTSIKKTTQTVDSLNSVLPTTLSIPGYEFLGVYFNYYSNGTSFNLNDYMKVVSFKNMQNKSDTHGFNSYISYQAKNNAGVLLSDNDYNVRNSANDIAYDPTGTLRVIYKAAKHSVTINDDNRISSSDYDYNTTVSLGNGAGKEGYTFVNWEADVDQDGVVETYNNGDTFVMPNYDVTVTAVYAQNHTVTWKNGETTLETDMNVTYNAAPSYDSAAPTKTKTAQYSYTFAGWSTTPEGEALATLPNVTEDVTYYAVFTSSTNEYNVTWKNDDGTVLETDPEVAYGTMPEYNGTTPMKDADAECSYSFLGWSPVVTEVTGDAVYTAIYESTPQQYTITWMNGTTRLAGDDYDYGTVPAYTGETPVKTATNLYTYEFIGWRTASSEDILTEIPAVTGPATYYAVFSQTERTYSVRFENNDGSEITTLTLKYNDSIKKPSNPTYAGTAGAFNYDFKSWSPSVAATCTGDATYVATYVKSIKVGYYKYNNTVDTINQFYDQDGIDGRPTSSFTKIQSLVKYAEGSDTFNALSELLTNLYDTTKNNKRAGTSDADIIRQVVEATGTSKTQDVVDVWYVLKRESDGWHLDGGNYNRYMVTFVDENETDIIKDTTAYTYNAEVVVPENPTKAADETYTYTFKGWRTEDMEKSAVLESIPAVTGDVTYYAVYEKTYIEYTVVFQNNNGATLSTLHLHYNDPITKPSNPTYGGSKEHYTYTFTKWSPVVADKCTGDATYTAVYEKSIKVGYYKYNVKVNTLSQFYDQDGIASRSKKDFSTIQALVTYKEGTETFAALDEILSDLYQTTKKNKKPGTIDAEIINSVVDITKTDKVIGAVDVWYVLKLESDGWHFDGGDYNRYEVSFVDEDTITAIIPTTAYLYGENVEVPENPTKEGNDRYTYEFLGWRTENSDDLLSAGDIPAVTENATYIAVYCENEIPVIEETTTVEEVIIETTTAEVIEETTGEVIVETTTAEIIEETTSEVIVETTAAEEIEETTGEVIVETTTAEIIEETTSEGVEETTTAEEIETTTAEEIETTTAEEIETTTAEEIIETTEADESLVEESSEETSIEETTVEETNSDAEEVTTTEATETEEITTVETEEETEQTVEETETAAEEDNSEECTTKDGEVEADTDDIHTGDAMNYGLLIAMLGAGAIAMAVLAGKKKFEEE